MSRADPEWSAVAVGLALAGVGWGLHATLLALAGVLTAATALLLWIWQRECLTAVTYHRTLSQSRAVFGERLTLDVEFVNDKLLPLTWLHVADQVPARLTVGDGAFVPVNDGPIRQLNHLLPMLPYARVRRRLTVVCDHRGEHSFGPARLRSSNPGGYRQTYARLPEQTRLLVYPKLFRLTSATAASRVPLGDGRSRLELLGDPSRPVGVRDYRAGDPIRHVDWRASARSTGLLVRVFEPTVALRVAVFADPRPPRRADGTAGLHGLDRTDGLDGSAGLDRTDGPDGLDGLDVGEFAIAVTASVLAELASRRVATGLYSTATIDDRPLACAPSSSAAALPAMLEQLARCTPWGPGSFGELLAGEAARLGHGASVVVIAANFSSATLAAIAQVRRRVPVTVIRIAVAGAARPPADTGDLVWEVAYRDDWKDRAELDLAR